MPSSPPGAKATSASARLIPASAAARTANRPATTMPTAKEPAAAGIVRRKAARSRVWKRPATKTPIQAKPEGESAAEREREADGARDELASARDHPSTAAAEDDRARQYGEED